MKREFSRRCSRRAARDDRGSRRSSAAAGGFYATVSIYAKPPNPEIPDRLTVS
jgi:hypothetical protein